MPVAYSEVVQGDPSDSGGRFNGEGGVRKEWWWQAGPVDSCCFCCSLRAGVAILATLDLLYKGIYGTFYLREDMEKAFNTMLGQLQHAYVMECSGTHAGSDKCLEMKHTVEQLEDQVEVFDNLPVVFYVQGVIAIIAGAAGLWAVFGPNALAAKVYLWTWFPRFIAMMATEIVEYFMMKDIGVDQFPAATIVAELVNVVLIMYFVKVLWSYQTRLDGSAGNSPSFPDQCTESTQLSRSTYNNGV